LAKREHAGTCVLCGEYHESPGQANRQLGGQGMCVR
jgi:hypothetical protein